MGRIKLLTGCGLALCCMLSASGVAAQTSGHRISDIVRNGQQAAGYTFCSLALPHPGSKTEIYYSNVFSVPREKLRAASDAFVQFLAGKYSLKLKIPDSTCGDLLSPGQADAQDRRERTERTNSSFVKVVETGWTYSGAGPAGTPTSAAAQPIPSQPGPTHTALSGGPKPDWQNHIDWCTGNYTTAPGQTNCSDQYTATEPKCITGGGRACLMERAIDSAKHNNCSYAFRLTLICQCQNGNAQQQLGEAGQQNVCDYEKAK
jgi:hypothetical protein